MKETPLFQVRRELNISQEKLAHQAGLALGTYRKAENGEDIRLSTARRIFETINRLLSKQINFEQIFLS